MQLLKKWLRLPSAEEEEEKEAEAEAEAVAEAETETEVEAAGHRHTESFLARDRSPLTGDRRETEAENTEECKGCGLSGGNSWVQCDLCDGWFHIQCINVPFNLEELAQEWFCDFCTRN